MFSLWSSLDRSALVIFRSCNDSSQDLNYLIFDDLFWDSKMWKIFCQYHHQLEL